VSNLVDIETQPVIDVWGGGAVRARKVDGERATLSVVELAPNSVVPGHRHENEQIGMCITGSITFTIGDERRELGPGGTWRIPSDTPHQASVGPAGAVVVDIFAPVRTDWNDLPSAPPSSPIWPPRD
jgi:quercetin dioxygenase-like cupin family protein